MVNTKKMRDRFHGTLRENSRLALLTGALLILSGIIGYFLPTRTTLLDAAALVVAGVAIIICSKLEKRFFLLASFVLTGAMYLFYSRLSGTLSWLFPSLSAALVFFSAVSWRFNVVPRFVPKRFALPLLNVISMVLGILCMPAVARGVSSSIPLVAGTPPGPVAPQAYYLYLIAMLLPFACVFLLNMALQPASKPPKYQQNLCTKSAPKGGILFVVASWLLLAGSAAELYNVVFKIYDVTAFILALPLVAAGILFVMSKEDAKRFLAATICLALSVAVDFFNPSLYGNSDFWTYSLPILLMLISSIGIAWNIVPAFLSKISLAPRLNVIAALLIALGIVLNVTGVLQHNSDARERRDTAVVSAATDAGRAVSAAGAADGDAAEALTDFSDAVTAYEMALAEFETYIREVLLNNAPLYSDSPIKDLMDFAGLSGLADFLPDMEELIAGVTALEQEAAMAASDFDAAAASFSVLIETTSADAADAFERSAAEPPSALSSGGRSASAAPAPSAPETRATGEEDPLIAFETALLDLGRAETAVTIAFERAVSAYESAAGEIESSLDSFNSAVERAKAQIVSLPGILLMLLSMAGLVLLNISVGSSEVEQRGAFAAFIYRCRMIHRWFYRGVGGKLQMLAKVQGVICLVIASLSAIAAAIGLCGLLVNYFFLGAGEFYLMILASGVAGIAASFILALPTWLTYAFGQITKDLREIKETELTGGVYIDCGHSGADAAEEENPDELPEL